MAVPQAQARPSARRRATVPLVCGAVAVVSLVVPASIAFDPWAWLVWGRQVGELGLDTTGGPSWKPLPVLVTTILAPLGELAPAAWLVVARTAGLLAIVLTYRLAARFAGRAAGLVAAGLLLLTPDGGPRFLRLLLEGHTAPAEVALCLWAVESHLDGRRSRALLLGAAMALLRPEAWPFFGAYALWCWWREPASRPLVLGTTLAIPVLWFGGDWWGSGDPWHGADSAQVIEGSALDRLGRALDHAAKVVVAPAWVAAAAGVLSARRRGAGERVLVVLAGAAVLWLAIVVVMSVALGYAALSRFLLPAGAVLCVLAGVGVVRLVAWAGRDRRRTLALAAGLLVALPFVAQRATALGALFEGIEERARSEADLEAAIVDAGGPEVVRACGEVSIDRSLLPQAALAWRLGLPLDGVSHTPQSGRHVAIVRAGGEHDRRLDGVHGVVVELGRSSGWVVHAVSCPVGEAAIGS